MQRNWKGKNIDLSLLTNQIGNFFKTKDFEAIKGQSSLGYQIIAANSPYFKLEGHISLSIEGKSDDFIVKLELCNEKKRHAVRLPSLLETMFIGGYFSIRELKSREAWMKLEKELWQHIENVVFHLRDSSENATSTFK